MSLWLKGITAIQPNFIYAPFGVLCHIFQVISFLLHIISTYFIIKN